MVEYVRTLLASAKCQEHDTLLVTGVSGLSHISTDRCLPMEVVSHVSYSVFPWVSLSLGTGNPLPYSSSRNLSVLDSTCGWGRASALQCPAYFPRHNVLKIDAYCCKGHHFFLRVDQVPSYVPPICQGHIGWVRGTVNNGRWMSVAQIDSISLHQQNHWMPLLSGSPFLIFEGSPHCFHNHKVIYILLFWTHCHQCLLNLFILLTIMKTAVGWYSLVILVCSFLGTVYVDHVSM